MDTLGAEILSLVERLSTIGGQQFFLLIISPIITFQWLKESMRVRGFQINRCFHAHLSPLHS